MYWLDRINQMKKEKGMTTDDISNLSGIPKGTLNKLFAGQTKDPQLSTVKAVVHCMGFTLDDLDEKEELPTLVKSEADLTPDRIQLLNDYSSLNDAGQKAALVYMDGLVYNPAYKKCDSSQEMA